MSQDNQQTDAELLTLLTRGDAPAFEAIYKRYAALLYRYARKNISRNEDCEEMVHDVFESLWQRRESLHIFNLRYYLINAVRYKIIHYFRHSQVKKKYVDHLRFFETVYENITSPPDPDELHEKIIASVAELPERCQTAFNLRLRENLSNAEIAEKMNITKKTVELYMFKAFSHLRAAYDKIYST